MNTKEPWNYVPQWLRRLRIGHADHMEQRVAAAIFDILRTEAKPLFDQGCEGVDVNAPLMIFREEVEASELSQHKKKLLHKYLNGQEKRPYDVDSLLQIKGFGLDALWEVNRWLGIE